MALGREMHHRVVAVHRRAHRVTVADVALHEREPGVVLEVGEVLEVAGVGQRVEDGDLVVAGREHVADVVGPDEAGGAGDEELHRATSLADPGHPGRNLMGTGETGTLFLPIDEDAGLDWFGKPLPPSQGGAAHWRCLAPSAASSSRKVRRSEGHLNAAHDYRVSRRTSPLDRLPPWMRSLGFLPLWFVLPMTVGLVALVCPHRARVDPWLGGVRRGADHSAARAGPCAPRLQPPRLTPTPPPQRTTPRKLASPRTHSVSGGANLEKGRG